MKFYLSKSQNKDSYIVGNELRKELAGKPVLNANVLDYLFAHPQLIPEEWKRDEQGRILYIFFWGTIYCGSGEGLCVRCLYWRNDGWRWSNSWINNYWDDHNRVAMRAS